MSEKRLNGVLAIPKLKKWLKARRFSYEILAGVLGLSRLTIVNWMTSRGRPDFVTRFVIQALTGNDVRVSDWLTAEERGTLEHARSEFKRIRHRKPVGKPDLLDRLSGMI